MNNKIESDTRCQSNRRSVSLVKGLWEDNTSPVKESKKGKYFSSSGTVATSDETVENEPMNDVKITFSRNPNQRSPQIARRVSLLKGTWNGISAPVKSVKNLKSVKNMKSVRKMKGLKKVKSNSDSGTVATCEVTLDNKPHLRTKILCSNVLHQNTPVPRPFGFVSENEQMNSVFKIPSQILCQEFVDDDDDISILSIGSCGETFFNKIVDQPIQSSRCSHPPPPPTCKRLSYPSQILRGLSNLVFYDEEESIDASRILVQ